MNEESLLEKALEVGRLKIFRFRYFLPETNQNVPENRPGPQKENSLPTTILEGLAVSFCGV